MSLCFATDILRPNFQREEDEPQLDKRSQTRPTLAGAISKSLGVNRFGAGVGSTRFGSVQSWLPAQPVRESCLVLKFGKIFMMRTADGG